MTKLYRFLFSLTIVFLSYFIFVSQGNALSDNNVKKAKEFMQAGMYPQAVTLLEKEIFGYKDERNKEINGNPTNAEAQYLLAVCYLNQGNFSGADDRFASTVQLNPDYGYKIGKEFKKTADTALKKGRFSSLRTLYDKAINYDPRLKKDIALNLFQEGKRNGHDEVLSLSVFYDNGLRKSVADNYYARSQETSGTVSLLLLKKANEFSGGIYQNDIGKKALEVCDSNSSFEERKKCIEENNIYLDDQSIFDSSVQYHMKIIGHLEKAEINSDNPRLKAIDEIKPGDEVHYLSLHSFWSEKEVGKRLWEPAISRQDWYTIMRSDMNGESTPIWFRINDKPTTVYYWVERDHRPLIIEHNTYKASGCQGQ